MKRLKTETTADHTRLESFPYFAALAEHKLPLECYVNQLKGLAIIHGVMESALAETVYEPVAPVWNESLRKLPFLSKDRFSFHCMQQLYSKPINRHFPRALKGGQKSIKVWTRLRFEDIRTSLIFKKIAKKTF